VLDNELPHMEDDCYDESEGEHQHQFVMMQTCPPEYPLGCRGMVRCNWCDGFIMMGSEDRASKTFLHCQLRSVKEWQPDCFGSDPTVLDLVQKREMLDMDWSRDLGWDPRFAPKKMCDADMCWDCYEMLTKTRKFTWSPPTIPV
jgi:hypothetical protein